MNNVPAPFRPLAEVFLIFSILTSNGYCQPISARYYVAYSDVIGTEFYGREFHFGFLNKNYAQSFKLCTVKSAENAPSMLSENQHICT
jgi:hypothetical protein